MQGEAPKPPSDRLTCPLWSNLAQFNATRDRGQKTALGSMRGGCPGPVVPYRTWTIMKFLEIGEIIIIYCEAFINFCVPFFF